MTRFTLLDVLRVYRRQWWRLALVEIVTALALGVVIALLAVVAQLGFFATGSAITTAAGYAKPGAVLLASALVVVAFALTGIPVLMASIAAIVSIADDGLSGRRVRLFRSLAVGAGSAYRMTWTVLFAVVSVAALFVITPALLVLGAIGLLLTPLIRLAARRRPGLLERWPNVRTLIWCLVPFGIALRRLATALLSVPAVILESAGVVGANRAAGEAVRARRLLVLLTALAALLVAGALTLGALSLGAVLGGDTGSQVLQGLVQLFTLGLPVVALTVAYRRIADDRDHPLTPQRYVRRPTTTSVAWPAWVRRTATIMPGVLLLAGLSVVPLAAPSASAAAPDVSASFVVNTDADTVDATELATQQEACATGSGDCTYRAAIAEAQATALANPDGTAGTIAITFSKSMTIKLDPSAPPTFHASGDGGSGSLSIDGRGHNIVIDGQGAVQGLSLFSSFWGFTLRGLEFDNGYAPSGAGSRSQGGAIYIASDGTTPSLFDGLTFSGNQAVGGGAVFSNNTLTIRNSTFTGNALLPADGVVQRGGADIYGAGEGGTIALNNTFWNSTGGILKGGGAPFTLSNSIINEDDFRSTQCTGITSGSHNYISTDDFTCPGGARDTNVFGTKSMLDRITTPDGYPSVFPLLVNSSNPALGGGTDCPATDERGLARAAASCDAGAYELNRTTAVALASTNNPASVGTGVTFTATVTSSTESGSVGSGSVQFSIDGKAVGSAVQVQDGAAQYAASGLAAGTHSVVAVYNPASGTPYTPATSAALQQVIERATGPIGITASTNRAVLGDTVTFTFTAGDYVTPATGTFDLLDVTDGTPGTNLASDVAIGSDGVASVDVDSLATGEHKLVASYSGDDSNAPGTSGTVTVTVVAPTTTTLDVDRTSVAYGAPVVVTAHVAGTTSAHPTGDVLFTYGSTSATAKVDASGDATATLTDLPVGAPTVTAQFLSNGSYQGSTSAASTVTVVAASTSTTLATGQTGDLGYGVPVTLTATVTTTASGSEADPAGVVHFTRGGTEIGTGTLTGNADGTATATYTTTLGQLPLGNVSIVADFVAASGFVDSTSPAVTRSVVAATTTVTVSSDGTTASFGHTVKLSASVDATGSDAVATGSVVFTEGAKELGAVSLVDGVATLDVATLARGTHTITATYAGATNTRGSSGSFTQTIASATTTTSVTASATSIDFGGSVDLDVTVTASGGGRVDGKALVKDGSTTIATLDVTAGAAHATLTALGAGAHDLTVSFVGDGNVLGSDDEVTVSVRPVATTTDLQQSTTRLSYGSTLVLTSRVTNTSGSGARPTGSVEFLADGQVIATVPLTNGPTGDSAMASYNAESLRVSSSINLTAVFVPDNGFADSRSEPSHVSVTAVDTSTSLTLTAGSTTSTVTATATVVANSGSAVPVGAIRFDYANTSDSVALVDGVASLTVRLPKGPQNVTATFLTDSPNFLAGSSYTRTATIGLGAPDVTITDSATGDLLYGAADTLTADVSVNSAGPAPSGSVSFTAFGSGTVSGTALGTAALTAFGAAGYGYSVRGHLATSAIPAGTTRIVATYTGDDNYGLATSGDLARIVTAAGTTTSVSSSRGEPAWGGAESEYWVAVTSATGATPTGSVVLTVDGRAYAAQPLVGDRTGFPVGVEALGTHRVSAAFIPADANFRASTADLEHVVVKLPTTLELQADPSVVGVGERMSLTATLSPPPGYSSYAPAPVGGIVTVTEGSQVVCTMALEPGGPTKGDEVGTCAPAFDHVGDHAFVATYSGNREFDGSTSRTAFAFVQKKAATATLTAPAADLIGGHTVRLNWNVTGPAFDDAPITISHNYVVVCTSTARIGSCDYTPPANETGTASFALSYAGDSDWGAATAQLERTVIGCIPASSPTASPADGGTVVAITPQNCGSGYLVGTTVQFQATARDGYTLTGWTTDLDATGTTSLVVDPYQRTVSATALFTASCVTVTVTGTARDLAGGSVRSSPRPNCSGGIDAWYTAYKDDSTWVASFAPGTEVSLTAVPPTAKGDRVQDFYGWKDLPTGSDESAATTTFTVKPGGSYKFGAVYDSACYTDVTFAAPTNGTASLAKGDCYTPAGVAGWRAGSTAAVSTKTTGTGYFAGFSGGTVTSVSSTTTGATGKLTISKDHLHLGADYGVCYHAPLVVKGDYATGTQTPSGNCPSQGAGWFTPGTQVHLSVDDGFFWGGIYKFSGWSGLPTAGSFEDTYAFVNASGEFRASFYNVNHCVPLNLVSKPAGAFSIKVTLDNTTGVENSCPDGQWDTAQSFDGRDNYIATRAHIVATPLTAAAKAAVGVMGIATNRTDRVSSLSSAYKIPASDTLDQYVDIDGDTTITASACEAINATVTLTSPNGTSHTQANPGDADFINVAPTPTCGFGSYYTIGDPVFVQANAPDEGYSFVKWTGAITSTDRDPVTPVTLDGAKKAVALDASYTVKCVTLSSNWDGVSAFPAPNCPDTDASKHSYIGGTTVALTTTGISGKRFRGWTGAPDSTSGDTAIAYLKSDQAVYANYTSPSVGESISSVLTSTGDVLAQAAKKAVGVVATVVTALVLDSNPVTSIISLVAAAASGVSALLHAVGVNGSALDGFDDGLSYVTGMLTFITATSNCATVWSYGGTAANPSDKGVSGAVGTGIVKEIKAQQSLQQAAIDAAYNKPSAIPGVAQSTVTKAKVTVGRLATAASVGVSIYSEVSNASWNEDATTAWTSGGDAYLRCISNSIPSYMGVPALPPGT